MGGEARANRLADNPPMAGQDLGRYDLYAVDFGRGDHHMGEFDNMRRGPFHEKKLYHLLRHGGPECHEQQPVRPAPHEQGSRSKSFVGNSGPNA